VQIFFSNSGWGYFISSIDVFEHADNFLYAGRGTGDVGRGIGFGTRDQPHQVYHAILGDDLDMVGLERLLRTKRTWFPVMSESRYRRPAASLPHLIGDALTLE
jgi:hypothetical protein